MGRIALLLLLFAGLNIHGQKSDQRDPQFRIDMEAFLVQPAYSVVISTYNSAKEFEKKLYLKAVIEDCKASKGVKLTLSNGETIDLPNAGVDCVQKDGITYTVAEIDITNKELLETLKSTDIVKYQIGKTEIPFVFKEKGEDLKLIIKFSEEKN